MLCHEITKTACLSPDAACGLLFSFSHNNFIWIDVCGNSAHSNRDFKMQKNYMNCDREQEQRFILEIVWPSTRQYPSTPLPIYFFHPSFYHEVQGTFRYK